MKRNKSRIFALFSAAMLLFCGCRQQSDLPPVTGRLTITALDVGKADALILQTATHTVVVDTGNKGDGKEIEQFLAQQGVTRIDTLIITHFDKDHVGGAARLVNRMEVGEIYVPAYETDSEEFSNFREKYESAKITPQVCVAGSHREWVFDDVRFSLDAAQLTDYGKHEENDFSLCLYLQHGENTFLFTGDAEEARQQEILDADYGKVTFLKFPYHGHYLSTTEAFLDALAPQYAVICCSEEEPAAEQTIATLAKRGIAAYYTNSGAVQVVSDGHALQVTQEKE